MKIIIVSGRSGSGKSISLNLLEDLGYYCIDNLPAGLLPRLIDHIKTSYEKIAVGIDARNLPSDLDQFHTIIENFKKTGIECEIVYLDAEDTTLIKRFNETRRKHPLSGPTVSLAEAIEKEKHLLGPIAHFADLYVDTTHYTIHQLREALTPRLNRKGKDISILLQSFGYKYGVPFDSDFVFDVRCLPNPYWHPELRELTGRDEPIARFLNSTTDAQDMLNMIIAFLEKWIPSFEATNRAYMTVAIGCTGGQHRSVYIVEQLFQHLQKNRNNIQLRHREIP